MGSSSSLSLVGDSLVGRYKGLLVVCLNFTCRFVAFFKIFSISNLFCFFQGEYFFELFLYSLWERKL